MEDRAVSILPVSPSATTRLNRQLQATLDRSAGREHLHCHTVTSTHALTLCVPVASWLSGSTGSSTIVISRSNRASERTIHKKNVAKCQLYTCIQQ